MEGVPALDQAVDIAVQADAAHIGGILHDLDSVGREVIDLVVDVLGDVVHAALHVDLQTRLLLRRTGPDTSVGPPELLCATPLVYFPDDYDQEYGAGNAPDNYNGVVAQQLHEVTTVVAHFIRRAGLRNPGREGCDAAIDCATSANTGRLDQVFIATGLAGDEGEVVAVLEADVAVAGGVLADGGAGLGVAQQGQ